MHSRFAGEHATAAGSLEARTMQTMADAGQPVPSEFAQALRELRIAVAGEPLTGTPLTGGVSSDIWRIHTARGTVCAKRALAKLRVAADWRAPIDRNRYEARWPSTRAWASSS